MYLTIIILKLNLFEYIIKSFLNVINQIGYNIYVHSIIYIIKLLIDTEKEFSKQNI